MLNAEQGKIVLAVTGLVLVAGLLFLQRDASVPPAPTAPPAPAVPELTEADALTLLAEDVSGGCRAEGEEERYRSCEVVVVQEGARAVVTVTHEGFFDDSVRGSRIEAVMTYQAGAWTKTSVVETYRCWPGRGHDDFSSELCV